MDLPQILFVSLTARLSAVFGLLLRPFEPKHILLNDLSYVLFQDRPDLLYILFFFLKTTRLFLQEDFKIILKIDLNLFLLIGMPPLKIIDELSCLYF